MKPNFSLSNIKMDTPKIDGLNILLILVSLLLAYELPFGLFLFSYAVLGPLHYLTEINWLKQKNYFVKERKWVWVLIFLAVLSFILLLLKLKTFHLTDATGPIGYQLNSNNLFNGALLISLLFAIGLVYLQKGKQIMLFLVISALISFLLLKYLSFSTRLLCVFLPTIVHVYLFTLLFMIAGTLNTMSKAGIIAIILLMLCPVIIFTTNIDIANYRIAELTMTTFTKSGFYNVNTLLARMGGIQTKGYSPFLSVMGIKIQIFIAFCYTYHYLNWFSKTSIIGWNKNVSIPKFITIIIVWIGAVGLYWYNYIIGFNVLFLLSTMHVFLEFPLNISSIKQIFLRTKLKARQQSSPEIGNM